MMRFEPTTLVLSPQSCHWTTAPRRKIIACSRSHKTLGIISHVMIPAWNEFNIQRKTILLNLGQINYKISEEKALRLISIQWKIVRLQNCQIRKILMILILSDQRKENKFEQLINFLGFWKIISKIKWFSKQNNKTISSK